jgi:transposase
LGAALRGWHGRAGAPACGRGAPCERGQEQQALGGSRGGFSTKLHLRAEGNGKPLTFLITAGERHEQSVFVPLMEQGAVKRAGRERPRLRPRSVVGDKGYSSRIVRRYLARRGIRAVIAHRTNELPPRPFDRERYRERNRIERLVNRLKQFRRIATRYEKLAENYLAMVTLAALVLWL